MEPLEQQRDLLGRDGLPLIAHGDVGLLAVDGQSQIQGGLGRGELGRVLQQVVDHLSDEIPVSLHHHGVLGDLRIHVQPADHDLLLHGQQGDAGGFAQVELLLFHLLVLDLGDVQHTPHQTAEPPALVRDDLQILPFLLRWDGAVQNAIGITGDGSHRRFQLVGHVGDEVAALPLRLLQRICHGVECRGQLADLAAAAGLLHPHVKVAAGVGPGGLHHLGDGLDLLHGRNGAGDEGNEQDDGAEHEKQADERPPHLHQRRAVHDGQHQAQHIPALVGHGHAHHELLLLVDAHGTAPLVAVFVGERRFHDLLRHPDGLAHQPRVGCQEHVALPVADQEVHVRHAGRHACQRPQRVLLCILRVVAGQQVVHRQLRDQVGPIPHLAALFLHGVVVAQGVERYTQQYHGQQHHTGAEHKLPPVQAVHGPLDPLPHGFTSLRTCSPRPTRS